MPGVGPSSTAARCVVLVAAMLAVLVSGCTATVPGSAIKAIPGLDDDSRSPVDVDAVLLANGRMRAITGGGDDLTIVPSMDGKFPVDIDILAGNAPDQCRWFFAETQTFGPNLEEFHKTTYQLPPRGGLISQGAAGYQDGATARQAFDTLAGRVSACEATPEGALYVGDLQATADSVRLRSGDCGRDYRLKSVVLVEVTFCRFPPSVPDTVLTNLLAQIPG
jgi:hypothetical protein